MTDPSFFNVILVWPILNILVGVYKILLLIHIPYALGFSIIVLTVIIRFILYPLISSQLRASRKMQEAAPHISKLKEIHKGDAKRLQAETMKLYKERGINPLAGCLPVIVQLPIIWALYYVLQQIVDLKQDMVVSQINKIVYFSWLKLTDGWSTSFFGLPLGASPSNLFTTIGPLVIIVPVLTGFLQFLLSKMLVNPQPQEKNKEKDKEKKDDFGSAFQAQSMYIFPIMIGFFSYTFSIGLSLYWNTFTIFGIIQQYKILGLGGLAPWKNKIFGQNKI
ncbi:MAG: YidC/Oxa1 family membrane protein insertase [Candidatus Levybacteria bacterium]|nr:YidC/Oxa1 family membrane protein insertase [Candidatus Levybacteria bacterium]